MSHSVLGCGQLSLENLENQQLVTEKNNVDFLLGLLIVCEISQRCYGTLIYGNRSVTLKLILETVLNKERKKQKRTKAMWLCRNHYHFRPCSATAQLLLY